MLVKRLAACTHLFQPFPSIIQPLSLNVRHFSTFLHILAFPGYAPGTIAVNVTRIEREFNACQTPLSTRHLSLTVSQ